MKNYAAFGVLLLAASFVGACGDDGSDAEFSSRGSGEANRSPLWPLTAGSRWANEPSQVDELFVYAVEPGTAAGRVRLVSQDVVADLRLRDDGVYYGGSSATGWLDEPVLFLPAEAREGMRWSDGGMEFEVLSRTPVQGENRVEVEWAVLGPSFSTGEPVVRYFVEGRGIAAAGPPGQDPAFHGVEFARVLVSDQVASPLPSVPSIPIAPVTGDDGEPVEWAGEALDVQAVDADRGATVTVRTAQDGGARAARFALGTDGVATDLEIDGDLGARLNGGTGEWVSMDDRDRVASSEFGIFDVDDVGLHTVEPTWGHRWRPVHSLSAFRDGVAFVAGDREPEDEDAVDMVFASEDGLWTWGSNDADLDEVGGLLGAKYGRPSVRETARQRDVVVVDPDGQAFRIPVSGARGRIEYLGRATVPDGYRAVAGVLLSADITAPVSGDTLLVALVRDGAEGSRTSVWAGQLVGEPVDVTDVYPGVSIAFLNEDVLICWPRPLGTYDFSSSSPVTLDSGVVDRVLVEDLGFAFCATVVRGGPDPSAATSRIAMNLPTLGRISAEGPSVEQNLAAAFVDIRGGGRSPIVAMSERGVERIWAADIVHSAAGVPLHDASGPDQRGRVVRAATVAYAFAPEGAGMLIHANANLFQEFFSTGRGDTVRFRETAFPLRAGGAISNLPSYPAGGGASFVASVFSDEEPQRWWERFDANGRTRLEGLPHERGPLPATADGTRCVEVDDTSVRCVAPDGGERTHTMPDVGVLARYALPEHVIWLAPAANQRFLLDVRSGEISEVCIQDRIGATLRFDAAGNIWSRDATDTLTVLTPEGCLRYSGLVPDGRDGPITDHFVPLEDTFIFFREVFSVHPVAVGVGVSGVNQQMIRVPRPAGVPVGPG